MITVFVVNAAWQVTVIAIVASICAKPMRNAPASARHAVWVAALVMSVVLPIWSATPRRVVRPMNVSFAHTSTQWGAGALAGGGAGAPLRTNTNWIPIAYALIVAIRVAMLLRQFAQTRNIVRNSVATGRSISKFGVRDVPILTSSTPTPITVGAFAPVIIFPATLADQLSAGATDALLGHEVAHIRRRDFAINLILELLAIPIAFHPATAFLRRRIAQTRELACDEMVTPALIPPRDYARALVDVAAFACAAHAPAYALAMAGRDFEERVLHIVRRRPAKRAKAMTIAAFTALGIAGVAAASAGLHPQVFATSDASIPKDAQARAALACAAGTTRDAGAIPRLIAILGDDTSIAPRQCYSNGWSPARATFDHPSPGEQAALALASISRPSFPSLLRALDDRSPVVRRNAAWAIGEMRGGRLVSRSDAIAPLIRLTSDRDATVRRAAAFGLSALKVDDGVDSLIALLSDEDADVRAEAAYALGEIRDARAAPLLHTLKDNDPNAAVRRAVKWALHELED